MLALARLLHFSSRAFAGLLVLVLLFTCDDEQASRDPALEGLQIQSISPRVLVPGSTLVIRGQSFVGAPWGIPKLIVTGQLQDTPVRFEVLAQYVDGETLHVPVDDRFIEKLGSELGTFEGQVIISINSAIDRRDYPSPDFETQLSFVSQLTPEIVTVPTTSKLFVNDKIVITTQNMLLGGNEGTTTAVVDGCFTPLDSDTCTDLPTTKLSLLPANPFERTEGVMILEPTIAGISPGTFSGTLTLQNRHGTSAQGSVRTSNTLPLSYSMAESTLFSVDTNELTLGRYLVLSGAGFVDTNQDGQTLLQMTGEFTADSAANAPVPIDFVLVPEFVEGRLLRYIVNEDDAVGQQVNLRTTSGTLSAELRVQVQFKDTTIIGAPISFQARLSPVRQIVYLKFTSGFPGALRSYGLRAVDANIRNRIAEVVRRDYHGVNLEVRLSEPTDYSLYSVVEIGGIDPNGLGLLGYDNTPGKDTNNNRLHDYIGGVNASTQEDGYPGYGGVFIDSLFAFSEHPGSLGNQSALSSPLFDKVFDVFRIDQGNKPVRASDLTRPIVLPTRGQGCPATERSEQIACAIWTLGNLVGSTVSHEIGHSLGLANPTGSSVHHLTDGVNRIMDAGGNRPFAERAELQGLGPARFCIEDYQYLKKILPNSDPEDLSGRVSCF